MHIGSYIVFFLLLPRSLHVRRILFTRRVSKHHHRYECCEDRVRHPASRSRYIESGGMRMFLSACHGQWPVAHCQPFLDSVFPNILHRIASEYGAWTWSITLYDRRVAKNFRIQQLRERLAYRFMRRAFLGAPCWYGKLTGTVDIDRSICTIGT